MNVQSELFLRGAWYAVEQSGVLLKDAITLHSSESYASAVVLALLSREEFGRGHILLDLWRKASDGTDVSSEEMQNACDDHIEKQRRGQNSVTYRLQGASGLTKLMQDRSKAIGTPEYAELDNKLKKIDELKMKKTPPERHSTRLKAMYVDFNEATAEWNRPCLLAKDKATDCLTDAINDYLVNRDRLTQLEILRTTDPDLAKAIGNWSDRPALPLLIWPAQE